MYVHCTVVMVTSGRNWVSGVLTEFVVMICLFSGDNKVVESNPLSEGFARYAKSNTDHFMFEFLLNYVQRMKSDLDWKSIRAVCNTK